MATLPTVRVAMWSCSRNCSTAMMRSWGSRADTVVWDEPLYAPWLSVTDADHPMRAEVLATHETDWREVVRRLSEDTRAPIVYEKHISKHLLPGMDREWLRSHRHAFLIREPRGMLLSFQRKMAAVTVEETGLPQQAELWQWLSQELGVAAPVVDAGDLLRSPARVLRALCSALELPWSSDMLRWSPGRRESDGVWARHWYDAVERSTGFQPFVEATGRLAPPLEQVRTACFPAYAFLHARRLVPMPGHEREVT